jgi:antitoxin ParD1/3/4
MPTMNVNLTPALADFVAREVENGDYQNASELVRAALRLLRREKERDELKLSWLRYEVGRGLEQANAGEFSTRSLDEIAEDVLREFD